MKKSIFILGLGLFVVFAAIILVTCKMPLMEKTANENEPCTFKVGIHDAPFKMQDKTVEAINITVVRMDIIRSSDEEIITLMDTPRSMNILDIAAHEPVVLSEVSVRPGEYDQLRLVLSDDCTIVVDGVEHALKTPSGQQTGVKLNGPFSLPAGNLFYLDLDFVAKESILHNKGQGYILKPVIEVTGTGKIIGIFRGDLALTSNFGETETLIELHDNNTFRGRISDYPDYNVRGDYYYNSFTKILRLDNLTLDAPDLNGFAMREVMKKMPETIHLPVIEWTLDDVIIIDIFNNQRALHRVNSFSFSEAVSYTELDITVAYSNESQSGKPIVVELQSHSGAPPLLRKATLNGDTAHVSLRLNNAYFKSGTDLDYYVTAYLFDTIRTDVNIDFGFVADSLAFQMSGSYYKESTYNPWAGRQSATISKDSSNSIEIAFPKRLNITMTPNDFSSNNPVISWEPWPGAAGYFVMVLAEDQVDNSNNDDNDGSPLWDVAFSDITNKTEIKVFSDILLFNPVFGSGAGQMGPTIVSGDPVRIEVYALDDSGQLDTDEKTGALYMDSLSMVR